jgi:hypothetical protein
VFLGSGVFSDQSGVQPGRVSLSIFLTKFSRLMDSTVGGLSRYQLSLRWSMQKMRQLRSRRPLMPNRVSLSGHSAGPSGCPTGSWLWLWLESGSERRLRCLGCCRGPGERPRQSLAAERGCL